MAEINRIVALGCSFTFGQYLDTKENVGMGDPPRPGKLCWPNQVAAALGVDCVNLAWPGSGCRLTAFQCLQHAWQPGDHAVILWPNIHRHWFADVADPQWITNNWCPNSPHYRRWWKRGYSNDNDREVSGYMNKTLVKLCLEHEGVTSTQFTYDWHVVQNPQFQTPWIPVMPRWFDKNHKYYFPDLALDREHMGPRGHTLIAAVYIKEILASLKGPRKNF